MSLFIPPKLFYHHLTTNNKESDFSDYGTNVNIIQH